MRYKTTKLFNKVYFKREIVSFQLIQLLRRKINQKATQTNG